MAISYVGAGVFASGTTSAASAAPTGATTDAILALVGCKPFSSTPTGSGFTTLNSVASGAVANSNGGGSVLATAFSRDTVPATTTSDTFSVTSGSPTMAQGVRFARSGGAGSVWSLAAVGLSDTDETVTTVNATGTASAGQFASGDWIVLHVVIKDDVPTHTSQAVSITGCTVGSVTWLARSSTTTGNDGAQYVGYASITAGSSSGSMSYTATSSVSGASSTAVNVVRLREVTATPTGLTATPISASQIDLSWGAVTGATSYVLERSADGSTGWGSIYTGATASYSDTGRASNTAYYYRVSAVSSLGTSAASGNASTRTFLTLPVAEDFASGTWDTNWTPSVTTGTVATGATVSSGAGVLQYPGAIGVVRAVLNVPTATTDQGVLLTGTWTANTPLYVTLRGDKAWSASVLQGPNNGYSLAVGTTATVSRVLTAGTQTTPTETGSTGTPVIGTAYKVRFEVVGTTLQYRVWDASGSEPSTWVTATNATHSAGGQQLGVSFTTAGQSVTLDDISYYVPSAGAYNGTATATSAGSVASTAVKGLVAAVTIASAGAVAATAVVDAPAKSSTVSVSSAGSVTATAVVGKVSTVTVSSAGTVSTTGVVAESTTATVSSAGSVSATGVVDKPATATATSAGSVSATGVVAASSTASVSSAGAVNATASLGRDITASATSAGSVTATGVRGVESSSSIASAGSVDATAEVGLSSTANVTSPASVDATGSVVAASGTTASVSSFATITATPVLGLTGAADISSAASVSATAVVARSTTASVTSAGSVDADASRGIFTTASASSAASVAATGSVTIAGQATSTVSSAASVSATAVVARSTTASVSSSGSVDATAVVAKSSTASVASAGSVTSTGSTASNVNATASVTSTGAVASTAQVGKVSTSAVSSAGSVSASGVVARPVTSGITSTGEVSATAQVARSTTATVSGSGSVDATAVLGYTATASVTSTGGVTAEAIARAFGDVDTPDTRTRVIPYENRTRVVLADPRVRTIPADDRTRTVPADRRARGIPAEPRTRSVSDG